MTELDLYSKVLEKLPIDPDEIIAFRPPKRLQQRVSKLLTRNNAGKLSRDEELELHKLLTLETTVRVLKTKALLAKSKAS